MEEKTKCNDCQQPFELTEQELEGASGGWTENRWDAERCGKITKASYDCAGLLSIVRCDHYRFEKRYGADTIYQSYKCVMGRFNYKTEEPYDPSDL